MSHSWEEFLRRLAWYLWLAISPRIKKYLIGLDEEATNNVEADTTNTLVNGGRPRNHHQS